MIRSAIRFVLAPYPAFLAASILVGISVVPAVAEPKVPLQELEVTTPAGCRALGAKLIDRGDGAQWLVGDGIELSARLNAPTAMTVLNKAMTHVTCYNKASFAGREKVFVLSDDNSVCGWVNRSALLSENALSKSPMDNRSNLATCENPRAMFFQNYCARFNQVGQNKVDDECKGVPQQLRTKGVLIGSTVEGFGTRYPMLSAPIEGRELGGKSFFSVLEVHDVQKGARGEAMLLVGDGAGELFGWIDRRALQLWPTRLSLYYDDARIGRMFTLESSMKENNRSGSAQPDVDFNGSADELKSFLHGDLPLVAYPIVRTVDPARDPLQPPGQPAWHEVIFIGKTGDGETSKLLNQVIFSNTLQQIQKINVVLAVDTTESMTEYLPFIRQGIATFIRRYNSNSLDQSKRLPAMRLSVIAYSDFLDKSRMKLGDPVKTEVLMEPNTLGPEYDLNDALSKIEAHKGLPDVVGEYEEAGLEAIVQILRMFDTSRAWFRDGPRIVIHVGDHGSRPSLRLEEVARELTRYKAHYIPIAVITDDKGEKARSDARERFEKQGMQLLAPLVEIDGKTRADTNDVAKIELADRNRATVDAVVKALDLVVFKVTETINRQRANYVPSRAPASTGEPADAKRASTAALDRASSRIRLDEALLRQYGLPEATLKAMVQSDKAFAPLRLRADGTVRPVNWNYFVAFEPKQVEVLQPVLNELCSLSGRADQRPRFRALIVKMAEIFSGDQVTKHEEMTAILSDLATLPGVRGSFLSIHSQQLLQQIESEDQAIQKQLRQDVCWLTYHLNNVVTNQYAQPEKLAWDPGIAKYMLRPGQSATGRNYRYVPLVGAATVFLPSWMFVVPSQVGELKSDQGGCTGWTCK